MAESSPAYRPGPAGRHVMHAYPLEAYLKLSLLRVLPLESVTTTRQMPVIARVRYLLE